MSVSGRVGVYVRIRPANATEKRWVWAGWVGEKARWRRGQGVPVMQRDRDTPTWHRQGARSTQHGTANLTSWPY